MTSLSLLLALAASPALAGEAAPAEPIAEDSATAEPETTEEADLEPVDLLAPDSPREVSLDALPAVPDEPPPPSVRYTRVRLPPSVEQSFVRNNRAAGIGFGTSLAGGAVGFFGAVVGLAGMFGGSGEVLAAGAGIALVGTGALVTGTTLGYVGTLNAASILRGAGVHVTRIWAHGGLIAAGISLFILPAPFTVPAALIAPVAQSIANRTAFMEALGRPPGSRRLQVRLVPTWDPRQATRGLALAGSW
ncbi:MAG: hypothetical protein EP330_09980 [Deltaproteobacteria bacterium]|nr:MAG: hypothetical protein EP330_09980 [Deltaproteobacteria bacterium]